jgi:hypothetical protein
MRSISTAFCVFGQAGLYVHLSVMQSPPNAWMNSTGKATLRDAGVSAGIATDKLLALTGQVASVQIANIVMPTAEERAELRAVDAKLDAIAARLRASALPDAGALPVGWWPRFREKAAPDLLAESAANPVGFFFGQFGTTRAA